MAWTATVTDVDVSQDGTSLRVNVDYADASAPTVVIDSHTFNFAIGITLVQARAAISTYGSDLRTRLATKGSKATQFVGQTIDIP
jgi:hypothetical protein